MKGIVVAIAAVACSLWISNASVAVAQPPSTQLPSAQAPAVQTPSAQAPAAQTQSAAKEPVLLTSQKESLRGLTNLGVVLVIESEADMTELNKSKLQTSVEVKLRSAGIRVTPRSVAAQLPGDPVLKLNITVLKGGMVYAYSVNLQFDQQTILKRDPSMATAASTWQLSEIGYATSMKSPGERIVNTMNSVLDVFINDYLAVNPK